jgi:fructose-1,6-bisphosphatase
MNTKAKLCHKKPYYNSAPQSTTAENIVFDFRAEITTLAKIINNRLPVQQL